MALRKTSQKDKIGAKVTANKFKDKENLKSIFKNDEGYKFLKQIRGTPPYWQSTMIQQLSIPNYF